MQKFPPLNRWQKVTAVTLLLCLFLSVGGLLLGSAANQRSRDSTADTQTALRGIGARLSALEAQYAGTEAREYLLLEHEGKIGVFSAGRTALYEIVDVRVSTLPARDREMLAAGITVVVEAALLAILEDYSS